MTQLWHEYLNQLSTGSNPIWAGCAAGLFLWATGIGKRRWLWRVILLALFVGLCVIAPEYVAAAWRLFLHNPSLVGLNIVTVFVVAIFTTWVIRKFIGAKPE